MKNNNPILPLSNELPSQYADRLGTYYTSLVNQEHKKESGQFFTPVEIAELMGSFIDFNKYYRQHIMCSFVLKNFAYENQI